MSLRATIQNIASSWPQYRSQGKINKKSDIHKLVVESFPRQLQKSAHPYKHFKFYGSAGQGNVSVAPWIATFDPRITSTAQHGFYPVYLFSTDLERVYLSFAFGVVQFEQQFKANKQCLEKIRAASKVVRGLCEEVGKPDALASNSINLNTNGAPWSYKGYEAGSIYSFPAYEVGRLPSDQRLEADFLDVLRFYSAIADNPLIPSVNELVDAAIPSGKVKPIEEYVAFEPREPLRKRSSNGGLIEARYSRESMKVGNAGEKIVVDSEKQKLISIGRPDLAEKVDHLAARGKTPGWDITSFDESGAEIYIEVKSSKDSTISSVELTRNEWRTCQDEQYSSKYFLYLVTNVLSKNPCIEVMKNPSQFVASGELSIQPSIFELSLRKGN